MKQFIQIKCPRCGKSDLVKNGHSESGAQRYLCNSCKKSFQTNYAYNACRPGVKEQIVEQTLNGGGVRDTARNLGISRTAVLADLKKKSRRK
jgi:transposase